MGNLHPRALYYNHISQKKSIKFIYEISAAYDFIRHPSF